MNRINTDGRTTVKLDVPDTSETAANKTLTADSVKTLFNDSGQDLRTAEAIGDAELVVTPLRALATNYKTTINAPRFDCEFFPTGNNAKLCVASLKTKTVRVPMQPAADLGTQTITADKLNASFGAADKRCRTPGRGRQGKICRTRPQCDFRYYLVYDRRSDGKASRRRTDGLGFQGEGKGHRDRLGYKEPNLCPSRRCEHDLLQAGQHRRCDAIWKVRKTGLRNGANG